MHVSAHARLPFQPVRVSQTAARSGAYRPVSGDDGTVQAVDREPRRHASDRRRPPAAPRAEDGTGEDSASGAQTSGSRADRSVFELLDRIVAGGAAT